jgi:flagellar motility protein MotE (MotC chaperone)
LKAVSAEVAKKLAYFEDIAEQQLSSEKNKARIGKLEKDVGRLISSADQQLGKVRGALDEELKNLKELLDKSAETVIPAAKERISAILADRGGSDDTWEFYTDKSGKWR